VSAGTGPVRTKESIVAQYLMSIYQPDGVIPPQEVLDEAMRGLGALQQEITAAGGWVFSAPLHPASSATVVHVPTKGGDALITDGPYLEGKEHVGGLWIVDAPDLDVALGWARKASEATTLPMEVRPLVQLPG
jgi:hypothetical protein